MNCAQRVLLATATVFALLAGSSARAQEWVTLESKDLLQYELAQANTFNNAPAGLYIKHRSVFSTTFACTSKDFVMITGDDHVVNRALASVMLAMTTGRTMRFWVIGCHGNYIEAKNLMLIN